MLKKYCEIDLRDRMYCPKLFSRLVWQQLYNIYVDTGCDTSHLDSLLCDLYTLEGHFKKPDFTLYWYSYRNHTTMQDFPLPDEDWWEIKYSEQSQSVSITRTIVK